MTTFHEGERAVQARAGVRPAAERVGRYIQSGLTDEFADFLEHRPFVIVGAEDAQARVWASVLVGGAGFARALGPSQLDLAAELPAGDPLSGAIGEHWTAIGLLAIDFAARRRIRVNGTARATATGFTVAVEQAYRNCPKFIQRRVTPAPITPRPDSPTSSADRLTAEQAQLIERADTLFIASRHHSNGADASHRGGPPGFVQVLAGGRQLRFPDYGGNRMFQTLGNLAVDPRAGLLFVDWASGGTLQLTGRTRIEWDAPIVAAWPGAERVIAFDIDQVHAHDGVLPAGWTRPGERSSAQAPPSSETRPEGVSSRPT